MFGGTRGVGAQKLKKAPFSVAKHWNLVKRKENLNPEKNKN